MGATHTNETQAEEREDLPAMASEQRTNLLYTVTHINEQQAAARTTVSELPLDGPVKHLGEVQLGWLKVVNGTAPAWTDWSDLDPNGNRMTESETLSGLLDGFHTAAADVDHTVRQEPDMSRQVMLPQYPWSPPEPINWTVRHILLHIFHEFSHHSGHADTIREALDGSNTTARMAEVSSPGGDAGGAG